jgi:hypothetical protein
MHTYRSGVMLRAAFTTILLSTLLLIASGADTSPTMHSGSSKGIFGWQHRILSNHQDWQLQRLSFSIFIVGNIFRNP